MTIMRFTERPVYCISRPSQSPAELYSEPHRIIQICAKARNEELRPFTTDDFHGAIEGYSTTVQISKLEANGAHEQIN